MPTIKRINWNQPLIESVTRDILATSLTSPCDLSQTTILVPTVQSGRRLRESLAIAKKDSGLFPPNILTPDQWLSSMLPKSIRVEKSGLLAAWALVLKNIDFARFQNLFPSPPNQSASWLLGMAESLVKLRSELGEAGLDFKQVAAEVKDTQFEASRWQELADLESAYLKILESQDLTDPLTARRQIAQTPVHDQACERILLIATPDPQALPIQALEQLETAVSIEVWIYGPENTALELFDNWGRPLSDSWQTRSLDLEGWQCHLQTCNTPQDTAGQIVERLHGRIAEDVTIGIADPELAPITANELLSAGLPHYDPNGLSLTETPLGKLTDRLTNLNRESRLADLRSLLQHPHIWQWVHQQLTTQASQSQALTQLDQITEAHLANDLTSLLYFAAQHARYATIDQSLKAVQKLLELIESAKSYPEGIGKALHTLFSNSETQEAAHDWKEAAEAIRKCLQSYQSISALQQHLSPNFIKLALKNDLQSVRTYPDRPKNAHDLLGWLELLWSDAPQLILAGMNEGCVPESVTADTYLPESLREHLGLRTNTQRFARDAYLLEALCRRRADQGQIELLIPKVASDQTPLKPSRLLFLGEPETLLPRTRALFANPSSQQPVSVHSLPWQLTPPSDLQIPTKLSVSSLRDYLQCPFRFFLKHILKMRSSDYHARELTPAHFGTLLHNTLAQLKGYRFDQNTKPKELCALLEANIDQSVSTHYGSKVSFALRLQIEALHSRAQAFAQLQVEHLEIKNSIAILDTEKSFEIPFEGCVIRGQVDRIDQCGDQRELIDYKTADSPKTPQEAHLKKIVRKNPPEHLPPEAIFEHEGNQYYWTDLQLPLYIYSELAADAELPKVAYFNLAKTLEKSSIAHWDDFSRAHLESAIACTQAIITRIQEGVFWPPNPEVHEAYDDFAPYFPDGIDKSVQVEAFAQYHFQTNAGTSSE